jgi:hypothetical protein
VRDQDWSDGDPPSDGERTGRSVADPTAADPSAADPTASDPTASDPVVVDPFDRSDVPPR